MTDNIQKLYKVAGVEYCVACTCYTEQINICIKNKIDNKTCAKTNKIYPPFAAEKQLELIKWVTLYDNVDSLQQFFHISNNRWCFIVELLPEFSSIPTERLHVSHNHFDQALAGLILQLWDELSSEQREEVREILQ